MSVLKQTPAANTRSPAIPREKYDMIWLISCQWRWRQSSQHSNEPFLKSRIRVIWISELVVCGWMGIVSICARLEMWKRQCIFLLLEVGWDGKIFEPILSPSERIFSEFSGGLRCIDVRGDAEMSFATWTRSYPKKRSDCCNVLRTIKNNRDGLT